MMDSDTDDDGGDVDADNAAFQATYPVAVRRPPRVRLNLLREDIPHPDDSAISRLLKGERDVAYIKMFGLTVAAFKRVAGICNLIQPFPSSGRGRPRLATMQLQLAVTLMWLCTTSTIDILSLL